MKRLQRVLLFLIFLCILCSIPRADAIDEITLYVPAFQGPDGLGHNVATILNLQIWQTFRRAPWPDNPEKLDFGKGLIIWDNTPLLSANHRSAEERAMAIDVLAQMVLWGKAYPYGDGVVVQTYLSIPQYRDYREQTLERWTVELNNETVTVDIPRRRHEMAPILLSRKVIERYTLPSALQLHSEREGGEPIGYVGDTYVALQLEPNVALVRSNGIKGWVRLPVLAKTRTEVVDFVGGVIRIFRGDWLGAIQLMRRVLENDQTRSTLKFDTYLYLAMAMEQRSMSARAIIEKARSLNPFSRAGVQYAVMSDLAQLSRMNQIEGEQGKIVESVDRIDETLEKNAHLFSSNDQWVQKVRRLVAHWR